MLEKIYDWLVETKEERRAREKRWRANQNSPSIEQLQVRNPAECGKHEAMTVGGSLVRAHGQTVDQDEDDWL